MARHAHVQDRSRCARAANFVGFTLIELLLTIAILAIVLTLAAPSFQRTINQNRVVTASNDLLYGLQFARSEAMKRNVDVVICPSSNQTSCIADGTDWTAGWIIYLAATPSAVLRVHQQPHPSISITGPSTMQYVSAGYLNPSVANTFLVTSTAFNGMSRGVCVNTIGSAEVKNPTC